jgi:hypothetical protein
MAKYAAILSALVAMAVGIGQYRRGVSQSMRELEWRQADMARTMINAMMNGKGWEAMTMLDWEEGRVYEIAPGTSVRILPTDVPVAIDAALRVNGRKRTETQRFITDRYDLFLFEVSQLQGAVRSGLVRKDDVQFPLNWYVEKRLCSHKKLLLAYIAENSTAESQQFFESLVAWRRCPSYCEEFTAAGEPAATTVTEGRAATCAAISSRRAPRRRRAPAVPTPRSDRLWEAC